MHKSTLTKIALILFAICATNACFAQDTLSKKQDTSVDKFPKAILVQLRSEHNRIAAATKERKYKELEIIKNDAINVTSRMIADFKDNFTFCPVYYYMDTNLDLIKNRVFKGILFNADSTPANDLVISDTSKDYLIVFYGYPTSQARTRDVAPDTTRRMEYADYTVPAWQKITDTTGYRYNSGEPMGKGLIINNYKFKQVSYLYKLEYQNLIFKLRKKNKKYIYLSKHYEIEYFPFAEVLNQKLIAREKKIRITNYKGVPPETLKDILLH